MKTLEEILLEATPVQNTQLKMIIDKTIPSGLIQNRLDMLKERNPQSLLSLLKINHMFKTYLLSEVMLVEDMLLTGIYKSEFGHQKCNKIIENNAIFPNNQESKKRNEFLSFIEGQAKKKHIVFENFKNKTLFEIFNSLTLGGKILLIGFFNKDVVASLLTSNKTKHTKKDLINALEYSKRLRNHVAHNFFVLNIGPYLRMVPLNQHRDTNKKTLDFLFLNLENILKISSRGHILKKIKIQIRNKEIKKGEKEVNLRLIDCLLLE